MRQSGHADSRGPFEESAFSLLLAGRSSRAPSPGMYALGQQRGNREGRTSLVALKKVGWLSLCGGRDQWIVMTRTPRSLMAAEVAPLRLQTLICTWSSRARCP
jgi:hypothetical protein